MPLITVKVVEGVFDDAQKKEIATKLIDAIVEIEGEALRPYTLLLVEEVKSGDWIVGGQQISTSAVRAIRAGNTKSR